MKKLTCFLMALIMCLTMVPAVAFADGEPQSGEPLAEQYRVFYRSSEGENETRTVSVDSSVIADNTIQSFTSGTAIEFTFGQTPYWVDIEVKDANEDNNWINTIFSTSGVDILDDSLEFTPGTDTTFDVHVWWSEDEYNFDMFWPEEGQVLVEINLVGSETAAVECDDFDSSRMSFESSTKYLVDSAESCIDLLFTPGEGEEIRDIFLGTMQLSREGDNPDYSIEDDGTVSYSWSISSEDYNYMEVVFGGAENHDDPQDEQYRVFYRSSDDVNEKRTVSVGGNVIADNTIQTFTSETAIEFIFGQTPYQVDIEIKDGNDENEWCNTILSTSGEDISDKSLSFTPQTDTTFDVHVWWSEEEYIFDTFGTTEELPYLVEFHWNNRGNVTVSGEFDQVTFESSTKVRLVTTASNLSFELHPDENNSIEGIRVEQEGTSGNEDGFVDLGNDTRYNAQEETFTIDFSGSNYDEERAGYKFVNINFDFTDNNEPGPGDPADPTGLDALKDALEGYVFAYYGTDADAVKTFMAKELSERRIGDGNAIGREDFAFGEIFGLTTADIKDCLEFKEATTSGTAIDDISYYPYTLSVADADPETDGDQPFEVEGCVYILNTDRDIVFAAHHDEETEYSIITIPNEEFATVYAYASEGYDVYGNAVMLNGIDSQDENIQAAHLTQEHAGLGQGEDTFPIGCRLVVSNNLHAVTLGYTKDAAAWAFANSNAYVPGEDPTTVRADVFCGSDEITFSTMRYGNEDESLKITGLEVLNLSANAVSVSGKKLTFHTDYDYAQVKITYDDSTSRYLNIYRVGLVMNGTSTSGTTDKSYVVWHGTDQSVRYDAEPSAEKVVTATFYYDMEGEIDNHGGNDETAWGLFDADVASSHAAINHVNLFVTISYSDGRTVRKIVDASDAITREANAVATENGGSDKDLGCTCGYAGQGNCHLYDDFILWSGSGSDFMKIEKITAIVYTGDENTFGGVKVGSGAGVAWENK